MAKPTVRHATPEEEALIDQVSTSAAIAAGSEAAGHVLRDIETVRPLKTPLVMPEAAGGTVPNATPLLFRPDDGFIMALAVRLVPDEMQDGRRLAVITEPFAFVHHVGALRVAVVAPVRYETDFASIPTWARWLISPFGRHAEAAVIHDWLYALGETSDRSSRRLADDLFCEALRLLGVDAVRRWLMFLAVRIGGGGAYGQAREFTFRHLEDLTPIVPPPDRGPYRRTVAIGAARRAAYTRPVSMARNTRTRRPSSPGSRPRA